MATHTRADDLRTVHEADGLDLDLRPLQGLWSVEQYLRLSNQMGHNTCERGLCRARRNVCLN